ncbi:Keratinocyte-associated protein 2 [Cinara cedri]|uniref:Keratinocyte-associated protein 2 n=1 Tax=Cinara cedri TaxID=506608 RepID=A0A5E4M8T6_9HEMI|nr:Keratinocyte-associated protein 2 [Cinara cedri]
MAVSTGMSFFISTLLLMAVFSFMHLNSKWLTSSSTLIIGTGFLGSVLFTLALTAISNLMTLVMGERYQASFFPEIVLSLLFTFFICVSIHRVCATTGLLFSLFALYNIYNISQKTYNSSTLIKQPIVHSKKKKH